MLPTAQDGPGGLHDCPKTAKEIPQIAPRRAEGPKTAQEAPKPPQELQEDV